jgi:intracellular septation protein A
MVFRIPQGKARNAAGLRQRIVRNLSTRKQPDADEEHDVKNVFARLATDFLSTIVFLIVYLTTDNVILATSVAIVGAVGQVIYSRVKGEPLSFMTWASLALVIVLGSATLLTHDPRFVLAKPSIAHFAIGAIMLRRGWMLRYVPPIVAETIPEYVTFAGYAWAVLMFALGAGVIAVASTGDLKLWAFYVSVVAIGAKIAAFAVQYVAFRILVTNRIRAAAPDRRNHLIGLER